MNNIGYAYAGFTTARLKRFLKTGGQALTFIQQNTNEYGEPTEQAIDSKTILGVLRTADLGVTMANSSQGSKTRSQSSVVIMTSWESLVDGYAGGKELSPGMSISIAEEKYKIIETKNLNNWDIIAEISLEGFDGWQH